MNARNLGALAVLCACCAPRATEVRGRAQESVATPPPVATAAPARLVIDFETETVGKDPSGWLGNLSADSLVVITGEDGHGGTQALAVSAPEGHPRPAEVRKRIAEPGFGGTRIRVSAAIRTRDLEQRSGAIFGVDIVHQDTPTRGPRIQVREQAEWRTFTTVLDVDGDAGAIDLVFGLAGGGGTAWLDDVELRVLGPVGVGDDPPAPLAGTALDNVIAFARLYGYVRYFYPGDVVAEARAATWEQFVANGVRVVEDAQGAADLAQRLRDLFAPIAPAVQIWTEGEPAPSVILLPSTADWTVWEHAGVGSEATAGGIYSSSRRRDPGAPGDRVVTLVTAIAGPELHGKSIRVRVRARTKERAENDAGLWVRAVRPSGAGFYVEPEMQTDVGTNWTALEATGTIDTDATFVYVGVQYIGSGAAWFEPLTLEVVEEGGPRAIPLPPWTPGTPGVPVGWREVSGSKSAEISVGEACEGSDACLEIRHSERGPEPPYEAALPGGIRIRVPLALESVDGETHPAGFAFPHLERPLVVADRATRLAGVIIAWNILQHFYPYFDVVGTDWGAALRDGLTRAAEEPDLVSFGKTLSVLMAALRDGHGAVFHPQLDQASTLPVEWEEVEGKIVLTAVSEACRCDLQHGDVVERLDGVPMADALAAAESTVSAATPQYRRYKALRQLRVGPAESSVHLGVRSADGEAHDVRIGRLSFLGREDRPHEARPASGSEIAPGVRYVDLDRCTEDDWKRILPDLTGARAVIYDMRGYPAMNLVTSLRHIATRPLDSARWNVPTPRRPDQEGLDFRESKWALSPADPRIPGAAVFLTDGRAVSAAETYMGIVEHYALGPIVGGPTAGTNGNVNSFSLPGGFTVVWTGMKVLKHDGSQHHGVGIRPTVPAERTLAGIAAGRDEVLERGIEVALEEAKRREGSPPEDRGP